MPIGFGNLGSVGVQQDNTQKIFVKWNVEKRFGCLTFYKVSCSVVGMKRYEFSRVQLAHMAQAVKPGDVERLTKETQLLKQIKPERRQTAAHIIRVGRV